MATIFSIIFRKQFIVAATGKKKILELLKKFKTGTKKYRYQYV